MISEMVDLIAIEGERVLGHKVRLRWVEGSNLQNTFNITGIKKNGGMHGCPLNPSIVDMVLAISIHVVRPPVGTEQEGQESISARTSPMCR